MCKALGLQHEIQQLAAELFTTAATQAARLAHCELGCVLQRMHTPSGVTPGASAKAGVWGNSGLSDILGNAFSAFMGPEPQSDTIPAGMHRTPARCAICWLRTVQVVFCLLFPTCHCLQERPYDPACCSHR